MSSNARHAVSKLCAVTLMLSLFYSSTKLVIPTCLWLDDEIPFPKLEAAGWGATGIGKTA